MEIRWGHICESVKYHPEYFAYDIHGVFRETTIQVERPIPLPGRILGLGPRTLVAVFQAHTNEDVEGKPLKLQSCDATGVPLFPEVPPDVVRQSTQWEQFGPGLPLMFSQAIRLEEGGGNAVPATGRRYQYKFFIGEKVIGQLPFFVTSPSVRVLSADPADPVGLRVDWAHLSREVRRNRSSGQFSLMSANEFTFLPPGQEGSVTIDSAWVSFLLSASPCTEMPDELRVDFTDGNGNLIKAY